MAWTDFRHRVELRVRWTKADQHGAVFDAH